MHKKYNKKQLSQGKSPVRIVVVHMHSEAEQGGDSTSLDLSWSFWDPGCKSAVLSQTYMLINPSPGKVLRCQASVSTYVKQSP